MRSRHMVSIKDAIQEVVGEIYNERGEVRPSELVERAKPVDSPAHDGFEWDDAKAGHEYRLIEARQWIRVVKISYAGGAEEGYVHVPIITSDGDSREGCYKPVSVVAANVDEYGLAMVEVKARVRSAKLAVEELKNAASRNDKKINFSRVENAFSVIEHEIS